MTWLGACRLSLIAILKIQENLDNCGVLDNNNEGFIQYICFIKSFNVFRSVIGPNWLTKVCFWESKLCMV